MYTTGQKITDSVQFCDDILNMKNDCFNAMLTFNELFMDNMFRKPCVYFLKMKGRIVYIGKTKHLLNRIVEHQKLGKLFDSFQFIITDSIKTAEDIEGNLIAELRPELNKTTGYARRILGESLGVSDTQARKVSDVISMI